MKYVVVDMMRFEDWQAFERVLNEKADLGFRAILTVGTRVIMARKDAPTGQEA